MEAVPLVDCIGTGRERGLAHGERATPRIHANIETYRQLFEARHGLDWASVRERVARVVPEIEAFDPDLLDELRGIADGAAVDFLDVVVLNARSSITMTRAADECTSIAALSEPGSAGGTLLGQNWDNMRQLEPVVLRVVQEGKPSILTFTEAGTLAKIGLNGAGIGLCVNGLCTPGGSHRGIPIFVMLRKALQMTSLSHAMAVITTAVRDAPHNYLLASREGAAFTVEALIGDFDILPPQGRFLVHTNHILSPRLAVRDELKASHPDTVVRLWRATRLLDGHRGDFRPQDLLRVLGDHFDAPTSICRHGDREGDPFAMQTNNAIVLELDAGRMWVTRSTPCDSERDVHELAPQAVAA
jgi:isopenicillin-N N-acyltransferase like protein